MKTTIFIIILTQICLVRPYDLIVGTPKKGFMVKEEILNYSYYPFIVRVQHYSYSGLKYQKIVGLEVLDNLHSRASVNVTAGGIGHSYLNLRMKSERGSGLEYAVRIFVTNES